MLSPVASGVPTLGTAAAIGAQGLHHRGLAMTHDVLGAEDAAWLHMEDETNPMVVNCVLELAARLGKDRVHALVERIAGLPRLRARVVESALHAGRPHFEEV